MVGEEVRESPGFMGQLQLQRLSATEVFSSSPSSDAGRTEQRAGVPPQGLRIVSKVLGGSCLAGGVRHARR